MIIIVIHLVHFDRGKNLHIGLEVLEYFEEFCMKLHFSTNLSSSILLHVVDSFLAYIASVMFNFKAL